ncbi:MAG: hypothetical protein RL662_1596 [Bacteroidota bacterium]|jgi:hypothetical protein
MLKIKKLRIAKSVAKTLSILMQPFLIPVYSVTLLLLYTNFYGMYMGQILRFLLPVFAFTFVLPSAFIQTLFKLGYIRDLSLSNRSERIFPYIIFIVSNVSLTYFFYSAGVYLWFLGLIIAPAIVALVGLIINLFWKISAHMLGIGCLVGTIMSVCFNVKGTNQALLFMWLFLFAGILGVSRLCLRNSTSAQVYVGFVVGFIVAYLSVFIAIFSLVISFK